MQVAPNHPLSESPERTLAKGLLWYIFYPMDAFEFDPGKSHTNRHKHGIDFVEAQRLWQDPDLLELPVRSSDEPRWLVVGRIDGRHWSAVITRRGPALRLISVRRSRNSEVALYESEDI